jgi:2',3'-cyclic-nucleotide 2'-phosphodiesterase (5'-nucleotidase family)
MAHIRRLASLGLAILALGLAACPSPAARRSESVELRILSTASGRGDLDDCGCKSHPKGGVSRRAAFIDSLQAKGNCLIVDGGDFLHPTTTHDDRESWFILRAMGLMGYDAMTLGEIELYRGAKYVAAIADSASAAKVSIVLANARYADSGKPVGKPFILKQVGGVTWGIIGLIGQDFGDEKGKFKQAGFLVDDPFAVASKLVPEVRKQADMVMVLAHLAATDAAELPKSVPGIDAIVFGHYPGIVASTQVGSTVTIRPGQRGQYVGETKITVSPENKIVSYSGKAVPLELATIPEEPQIAAARQALKEQLATENP